MSAPRRLCALAALADGVATLIEQPGQPLEETLVVVRQGDRVAAFVNCCPHMGFSLDWKPERLVVGRGTYLRCIHHGAVFRIADGVCVAGPCERERLTSVPVEIIDGEVRLAAETATSA